MIGDAVRLAAAAALAAVAFMMLFAPGTRHRALDPDEPIAADGSLIAGRAHTVFDSEPALGAFSERARSDSDDPKDFQERLKDERWWTDHSRERIAQLLGRPDRSLCDNAKHKQLIAAVRSYYDARGRQKASFTLRGPRAKAAIEQEWSTPLDQRIDQFVRETILSGFLRKDEIPGSSYPEFAKLFADTEEVGAACPLLASEGSTERP